MQFGLGEVHDTVGCIVTGSGLMAGKLCRNIPNCIVTRAGAGWGRVCHDTNFVT